MAPDLSAAGPGGSPGVSGPQSAPGFSEPGQAPARGLPCREARVWEDGAGRPGRTSCGVCETDRDAEAP